MPNRYNLNNLEALFQDFLVSGIRDSTRSHIQRAFHKNTIKNYLSDIRHFFGWIEITKQPLHFFDLSRDDIEKYKKYLIDNTIPIRTINRRLSAIRKLCFFCQQIGILQENPSKHIINISHISSIMNEFHHDLIAEGLSIAKAKNYIRDIQKFFQR